MFIFLLNCFLAFPFFPIKKDKKYLYPRNFIYLHQMFENVESAKVSRRELRKEMVHEV